MKMIIPHLGKPHFDIFSTRFDTLNEIKCKMKNRILDISTMKKI